MYSVTIIIGLFFVQTP